MLPDRNVLKYSLRHPAAQHGNNILDNPQECAPDQYLSAMNGQKTSGAAAHGGEKNANQQLLGQLRLLAIGHANVINHLNLVANHQRQLGNNGSHAPGAGNQARAARNGCIISGVT